MPPEISTHFQNRKPSAIRQAQILFAAREDRASVSVVNVAIGNVSLPMHPAMRARMLALGAPDSPFSEGVLRYSPSVGLAETQRAFLNVIASSTGREQDLHCLVTDGGSQAMTLMVLGVCGPVSERPLLLLDPAYTNYRDLAGRCGVSTVSVQRELRRDGCFSEPSPEELRRAIQGERPAALVVIPADNPSGQFLSQRSLVEIARVCVDEDIWLVGDEAYRQLQFGDEPASSIWKITEEEAPGITGCRVSIESASKVFNACGLRTGALVTDNLELRDRAVAEYTANLCANVIGQYIFGALAHLSHSDLAAWYTQQRERYRALMRSVSEGLREALPGIIVTTPEAALYSVIDVREICPAGFDAVRFVSLCAREGRVRIGGDDYTLLVAPMAGFYLGKGSSNPGRTKMRVAYVEPPQKMALLPSLFAALFEQHAKAASRG